MLYLLVSLLLSLLISQNFWFDLFSDTRLSNLAGAARLMSGDKLGPPRGLKLSWTAELLYLQQPTTIQTDFGEHNITRFQKATHHKQTNKQTYKQTKIVKSKGYKTHTRALKAN